MYAEAINCNHHVCCWLLMSRTTWDCVKVLKPKVKDLYLNCIIIDKLSAWENALHERATVKTTAWEQLFHVFEVSTRALFGTMQAVTDWNGLMEHLVTYTSASSLLCF